MAGYSCARALGVCAVLLASVSIPAIAPAQTALPGEVLPPERASYDANGVNVATGTYRAPRADLVIGSGAGALTASRIYGATAYRVPGYRPTSCRWDRRCR